VNRIAVEARVPALTQALYLFTRERGTRSRCSGGNAVR
jgi:hypothetical protein